MTAGRIDYCTCFDHRYVTRGLALYHSLRRHAPDSTLWVLCLSEECERILRALDLPSMQVIALDALERFDGALQAVKAERSLVEYYFTCSACVPRMVFTLTDADRVAYIDADIYFFSSDAPISLEMTGSSVGITPHRFTAASARTHARYGSYNVGLVAFSRDDAWLACLEWWHDRCIEWCFDRLDGDRYADQKYLEKFEQLFSRVHAFQHSGINLAPWNLGDYKISGEQGVPWVSGKPVVFFHFQGLKPLSRDLYDSNLTGYGARLTPAARDLLFIPYIRELRSIERLLSKRGLTVELSVGARKPSVGWRGMVQKAKTLVRAGLASAAGNVISVHATESA